MIPFIGEQTKQSRARFVFFRVLILNSGPVIMLTFPNLLSRRVLKDSPHAP